VNTFYHTREEAMIMTQHLANRAHEPAYTLFEDDGYHIATEADMIYWPDAAVVEEFRPDVIGGDPDDPGEGDGTGLGGRDSEGDDPDIPSSCACCAAPGAPILDGGRRVCVSCHLHECPICKELARCASCGDVLWDAGPRVCPACIEAGERCCPVCAGAHYGWQCPQIRLARIELAVMDALPKYALMLV